MHTVESCGTCYHSRAVLCGCHCHLDGTVKAKWVYDFGFRLFRKVVVIPWTGEYNPYDDGCPVCHQTLPNHKPGCMNAPKEVPA